MAKQLSLILVCFMLSVRVSYTQEHLSAPGSEIHGDDMHEHEHSHMGGSKVVFLKTYSDNLDTFQVAVDTFLHQIHNYNPMYRESMSNIYLGNYGAPYISNLYFDRPDVDFFFSDVYHAFYKNRTNIPYINTKTPYTVLNYSNGGPKYYNEESLNGLFSTNIGEKINLGAYFDIVYARGRYADQATRHKNYGFFSSYTGEKYSAYLNAGASALENYENGGFGTNSVWTDTIITTPPTGLSGQPENLQVRMQDDDARSYTRNRFLSLQQKYNIGITREVQLEDTVGTEFVPALNLVHQFEFETDVKQYEDAIGMSYYYDTAYIHSSLTTDSVRKRRVSNRVGLYLDERINNLGKFGAGAYIQMDNEFISQAPWHMIEDTSLSKTYSELKEDYSSLAMDSNRLDIIHDYEGYKYTNVSFGGSVFKRYGTHFFFDAAANVYLSGYNVGDWQVKGNIRQVFPNMGDWEVSVRANFQRKTPDYFYQHYYSNNFWWDNNFDATFKQQLGGTLSIPAINLKLSLDIDNMQEYLYFNADAMPDQHSGNMAVMALRLEKDFEIGKHLVWENDIVYQESSAAEALPLPQLTAYTNFYLRHILFKVLHVEIGAEARYHTAYNAPGYMPATGRYYNQTDVEVGNYPMVNVYADFFLRRMRFFVMGQHINKGWPSLEYFSAPHYAFNPRQVKFGLQWTFYD